MNKMIPSLLLAAVCSAALITTSARAADTKSYQVTGPVLEVTPTSFTVQKGDEKWEIARDKGTKMNGEVKVGAKVTIYYRMVATEVEIKESKAAPKSDTKGDAKKKKSQ
jgi:uncharacterized cupredoxin-like copper-binding protein